MPNTENNASLLYLRKGTLENLKKAPSTPGALSFTTDECAIYLDLEDGQRIRFGDIIQVNSYNDLLALSAPSSTAFYYPLDTNAFFKYNAVDQSWVAVVGGESDSTGADIAALQNALMSLQGSVTALNTTVNNNTTAIANEKSRAEGAELANATAIANEKSRAEGVEQTLSAGITNLTSAYTQADSALKTEITSEYQQYVMENLSVADAMHFKGEVNADKPLPTVGVEAGDTYKVTGQFSPDGNSTIVYYIGDMVIADSDQKETDATYQGQWIHVPSGYESSYDARLYGDIGNQVLTLLNGVGAARGTMSFVDNYTAQDGGLRFTLSSTPSSAGDSISISAEMLWGSF